MKWWEWASFFSRIYWEGFQVLTVEYYMGCGFIINSFYYVELCSLCTHFHQGFVSWMNVDFYQFCIYWHDHVVLILSFVDVVYHINWFAWFELSLWPWGESSLVVVYDLFYVLNSGCWYFKNFCVYLSRILTCNLLFWWCLCLVSVTSLPNFRVMVTS